MVKLQSVRYWLRHLIFLFYDTDQIISKAEGMTISEIFDVHGESYFRNMEKVLIENWNIVDGIVATGGGLPCHNDLIDDLNEKGITVYIEATTDIIVQRIKSDVTRPLKKGKTETELFTTMEVLQRLRSQFYNQADISVKSIGTPEQIANKILAKI
ncbi:MAG: shikimate kinase [Saprospiraceae bacterium]|nr:shikimate kinase [Saprospiraceae bacterium]